MWYIYTTEYYYFVVIIIILPHCAAVDWLGMEPVPPAVEAWSLNHWITREVLQWNIIQP